jgi:hypothetical protein
MMNQLDLIDLSRELVFIYLIDFVVNLYLVSLISIQISYMTWTKN